MIVKDESHIILDCLNSISPYIDYWVICDTGSSDGTQKVITDFFEDKNIPGELLNHEWINFGVNRTQALKACDGKGDYVWMIDADDMVIGTPDIPPIMDRDSYMLKMGREFTWWRRQIFKTGLEWKYIGVLHEYPHSEIAKTEGRIEGEYHISARTIGGRSKNISQREKYLRDAAILEQGLKDEPENERYVFYLAQSYRDAGEIDKAIEYYQKRYDMQKWHEEAYYALYQKSALCKKKSDPIWFRDALSAYYFRPTRLESLYEIIKDCRENGQFRMGYNLGKQAVSLLDQESTDVLFVHQDIHSWKFWDELSLCAYYSGDKSLFKRILESIIDRVPEDAKSRITDNLGFI